MDDTTFYEVLVKFGLVSDQVYKIIFRTETVEYWGENQAELVERFKKANPHEGTTVLWIQPMDVFDYVIEK